MGAAALGLLGEVVGIELVWVGVVLGVPVDGKHWDQHAGVLRQNCLGAWQRVVFVDGADERAGGRIQAQRL